MSAKPEIVKVEDHEGTGECLHCGREGIRWIVVLSDGSRVGLSCARKAMGYRVAPKQYNWIPDFVVYAEIEERGVFHRLWHHKDQPRLVRWTINLGVQAIGDRRFIEDGWRQRGWLTAESSGGEQTTGRKV